MNNKQKEAAWRERLKRYEQSSLGRQEFCRRNSLDADQLQYWQKRLRELDRRGGQFVQVSGTKSSVEIQIGSQVKLVISEGYNAAMVKSLVELLSDAKA
jgi:hypothetical protein